MPEWRSVVSDLTVMSWPERNFRPLMRPSFSIIALAFTCSLCKTRMDRRHIYYWYRVLEKLWQLTVQASQWKVTLILQLVTKLLRLQANIIHTMFLLREVDHAFIIKRQWIYLKNFLLYLPSSLALALCGWCSLNQGTGRNTSGIWRCDPGNRTAHRHKAVSWCRAAASEVSLGAAPTPVRNLHW